MEFLPVFIHLARSHLLMLEAFATCDHLSLAYGTRLRRRLSVARVRGPPSDTCRRFYGCTLSPDGEIDAPIDPVSLFTAGRSSTHHCSLNGPGPELRMT